MKATYRIGHKMRKETLQFIMLLILSLSLVFLSGCTERQRKNIKHMKSDIIGLKRQVTLYDCSGKVIKTWKGRFKIEINGSFLSFIDDNGRDIKVSGTVVVEEI